jgi:uncharacterized membrane protein HdeD (DUF308 family)
MSASTVSGLVKQSVGWAIALSVLLIVTGILAILLPPAAGIAVAILVAWLLVLGGIAHLVFAWHIRPTGGFLWELLIGILYLCVGIYLFVHPVAGLASLTLFLAAYLFVRGVLSIIMWFRVRSLPGAGWLIFDGIIAVILGIMIWRSWPSSSEWAIGTLIGFSMLFAGISRLSIALAARRLASQLP